MTANPTTFVSLLMLQRGMAIQVYYCNGQDTTFQVVSILEPEACSDPERAFKDPTNKVAQILQVQRKIHMIAQQ